MGSLPLPQHFKPEKVSQVWRVPYEERATQARQWAAKHHIPPASQDNKKITLLLIDVQNTFCLPDFELFVGGRSGTGAIDDNTRLCQFIYQNLGQISHIAATLDTHTAMQIFHAVFLVDDAGKHPDPLTMITAEDIRSGKWKVNPALIGETISAVDAQQHLDYYASELQSREKYDLTIWPYHAMLGGIGHALVSAVEEALFFHSLARYSPIDFILKGQNPLTEAYSAVGPEITQGAEGQTLATRSRALLDKVKKYDAVIIAGQAKSHCVAWTVSDLLDDIQAADPALAKKIYLLEDCTSPVVVPGVVDFTGMADEAFQRFVDAGMHIINSTKSVEHWI